ncbi:MAG: DUF2085 domain-containing protein [Myxococcales bacterium]|nr:DUF2085 domain-containing protein [Myxococcales bacterium]
MPAPAAPQDPRERERRDLAHQALAIVRVGLVLVGTFPWWLPLARGYLPLGAVGTILDGLFIASCHRLPSRTLHFAGHAMPLCSRCGGIYLGLALGAVLVWPRLSGRRIPLAFGVTGALMLLDVIAQDLGWHPMWHSTRIVTGLLVGWTASSSFVAALMRARGLAHPRRQNGWGDGPHERP